MNSIRQLENSPFVQLLMLCIFSIVGVFIAMILGFGLAVAFYGTGLIKDTSWLQGGAQMGMGPMKIMLVAQQAGIFLFPALLLARIERQRITKFYAFRMPRGGMALLVLLLMLVSLPAMGLASEWNQQMKLPAFLKDVEVWMQQMEESAARITEKLLTMKNPVDFISTLFVVAVVPAICEELLFRGAVQRIFLRMTKNYHLAIWISAAIFSAFHFEFYGFVPRLLLGAAFGYIYCWTGSLWYAAFAHFLNNAFAVCMAWYIQLEGKPISAAEDIPAPWYITIISAILTIVIISIIYKRTKETAPDQNTEKINL